MEEKIDGRALNELKQMAFEMQFELDDTKDYYAQVASKYFNIDYEDCLEFKDGVFYPEGKKRRNVIKDCIIGRMFLHGLVYGKLNEVCDEAGNLVEEIRPTFSIDLAKYENINVTVDDEGFIIPTKKIKEKLKELFFKEEEIKSIDATKVDEEKVKKLFDDSFSTLYFPSLDDYYNLEKAAYQLMKENEKMQDELHRLKLKLASRENRRKKNIGKN